MIINDHKEIIIRYIASNCDKFQSVEQIKSYYIALQKKGMRLSQLGYVVFSRSTYIMFFVE